MVNLIGGGGICAPQSDIAQLRCVYAALVEKAGYERGVSIRAAPYDFRYAPHSQPFWIANLRQLVEDTWNLNGHRKVVLVAHSMGGLYSAHFLSRQTAAWKDRYVEALITVNTPWTGRSQLYDLAGQRTPMC